MCKIKRKIVIPVVLIIALVLPTFPVLGANGGAASGVSSEMTKASYWIENTDTNADRVLMTHAEIDKRNQQIVDTSGVSTYDMTNFGDLYGETYNADKKREALSKIEIPSRSKSC